MKRKLLPLMPLFLWVILTNAQYVPNGGFENWTTNVLFEEPASWNTGNLEGFMEGLETALKVTDSYSGDYALRLETIVGMEDTLFGFTFSNGMITGGEVGDTLQFEGGFPISTAPDWFHGYFKYQMAANDTGLLIISFKSAGDIISQNMFPITGGESDYVKMDFDLMEMAGTPDTAIIAFACSNPDMPKVGGWLQIDSLWFDNIDDVIPNADFEEWEAYEYTDPVQWVTNNYFNSLFGGPVAATAAGDANSGAYALRLEAVESFIPVDEGLEEMTGGFAMPFDDGFGITEEMPTFSVDFNPSRLIGYYKYEPVADDTAMIYVALYDDMMNEYSNGTYLLSAGSYLPFEVELDYPDGVDITEVGIMISTSLRFMGEGVGEPELGSVLYIDDLDLINPCDAVGPFMIDLVSEPSCDDISATLDAGSGWDVYDWSTGEDTQTITVDVTEPITIEAMVYDDASGCVFEDAVELTPPLDCGLGIETAKAPVSSIQLFPNPTISRLTLKMDSFRAGQYLMELMDITGKTIISEIVEVTKESQDFTIDMSKFREGLYLFKLSNEEISYCEKIIKK